MAKFNYEKTNNTAIALIDKFGRDVQIERTTDKVINPVTGVITGGTTETFKTRGITKEYDLADIDGTLILSTDKRILINSTVVPKKTDKIKLDGKAIGAIVGIREVNPAGTALIFELQIRG